MFLKLFLIAISIVENLNLEKGEAVVTGGGDGTFCEVISGFMSRKDADGYAKVYVNLPHNA